MGKASMMTTADDDQSSVNCKGSTNVKSISVPKSKLINFVWIIIVMILNSPNSAFGTISIISEFTNATLATINDLPARFIPERFSFYGIQGYLVASEPDNACGKVKPPPDRNPPDLEYPINWILLARRSPECHFQTKIENAQNAGYTAIIIHNVDSNSTEVMGVEDPSKIIIYATFVGSYDGRVLKNHTYGSASFIRIQDDFSINGYLLPFAIVVGLCFIVMIIFMLWQQVLRWIRERRRSRRRKLPASALKKIPTQKWTKGDPYETCAVCLDDFVEQDKIRVLPCSHGFHMKCIDPWLTKGRRVCPICKRKVIVADERFNRGESDTDTEDESAPLLGTSAAPSNAQGTSAEETFVQQGHGESSSSSLEPGQSGQSPNHRQLSPQNLPIVHTRGTRGGVFSLIRSRQQRSAAQPAVEPSSSRPRPRPPTMPMIDSDSSSVTSVGSNHSPSPSHHSVLAEVHHSGEVLRQRMAAELELEPKPSQTLFDNVNANEVYVAPDEDEDVQILVIADRDDNATNSSNGNNENWSHTIQDAVSSRDEIEPNSSISQSPATQQNPIV